MYFIGQATDFHKQVSNKKLYLGGVCLQDDWGLKGHSDGDALLHVIVESILGAMQKQDLGTHFPSNNEKYKNISSLVFANFALNILKEEGYEIVNIDTTIISEKIMISKYRKKIILSLKKIFKINHINIKGTTTDYLLSTTNNSSNYVIAQAIVLIKKIK